MRFFRAGICGRFLAFAGTAVQMEIFVPVTLGGQAEDFGCHQPFNHFARDVKTPRFISTLHIANIPQDFMD